MSAHPSGDDRFLVTCPYCGAPPGSLCVTREGNYARRMHKLRTDHDVRAAPG